VASLAAAIYLTANAFHLSDPGLCVVYKPQCAKAAASPASRKRPRLPAAATAVTAAAATANAAGAAADGDSDGQGGAGGLGGGDDGAAAAVAAGIPVMTTDSHGPAGRVKCSCESGIFRVVGLAHVPPHLRSWH
jgi:hypothetical protein